MVCYKKPPPCTKQTTNLLCVFLLCGNPHHCIFVDQSFILRGTRRITPCFCREWARGESSSHKGVTDWGSILLRGSMPHYLDLISQQSAAPGRSTRVCGYQDPHNLTCQKERYNSEVHRAWVSVLFSRFQSRKPEKRAAVRHRESIPSRRRGQQKPGSTERVNKPRSTSAGEAQSEGQGVSLRIMPVAATNQVIKNLRAFSGLCPTRMSGSRCIALVDHFSGNVKLQPLPPPNTKKGPIRRRQARDVNLSGAFETVMGGRHRERGRGVQNKAFLVDGKNKRGGELCSSHLQPSTR